MPIAEPARRQLPCEGDVWQHANGGRYVVVGLATRKDGDALRLRSEVVYRSVDGGPLYVRGVDHFCARFTRVSAVPLLSALAAWPRSTSDPQSARAAPTRTRAYVRVLWVLLTLLALAVAAASGGGRWPW